MGQTEGAPTTRPTPVCAITPSRHQAFARVSPLGAAGGEFRERIWHGYGTDNAATCATDCEVAANRGFRAPGSRAPRKKVSLGRVRPSASPQRIRRSVGFRGRLG